MNTPGQLNASGQSSHDDLLELNFKQLTAAIMPPGDDFCGTCDRGQISCRAHQARMNRCLLSSVLGPLHLQDKRKGRLDCHGAKPLAMTINQSFLDCTCSRHADCAGIFPPRSQAVGSPFPIGACICLTQTAPDLVIARSEATEQFMRFSGLLRYARF
jgi:hypothetical protein